jgi:diadenosine tetraphosphate (Ap4A) HIT family hydrolase
MGCSICKIHTGEVNLLLKKTKHWVVRHSDFSKNCAGYFYIEPVRHVESFTEFLPEELEEFGEMLRVTTEWIHKHLKPMKIYTVTISEEVKHIHFHIVPRYTSESKGFDYLKETVSGKLKPGMDMHKRKEIIKAELYDQQSVMV